MQPYTQLSIIIPTYKRLEILKETYSHLTAALNNIVAEIIIINDDKSMDIPNTFINNTNTIIVNNKGNGAASARNLGATLAKGKLLLFIDDDILVNTDVLKNVLLLHQKYDRVLSTPLWEYSPNVKELLSKTPFGKYKLIYDYTPVKGDINRKIPGEHNIYNVDTLASFCLSIKQDHYIELNGMDENFPYAGCEDQDFTERARQSNFMLLLDEGNVVLHNELDRIKRVNWLTRQFNGVQGFVFLCQKFPEKKDMPLWKENTPIQKVDPIGLKFKKILKYIARQKTNLLLLDVFTNICEKLNMPTSLVFRLYNMQSGLYINKGFTKSYKKNACSSNNV
jgi:GT2 family glycosyltransferase